MKSKRVGLALSGGGARGLAHIGVLKVLEKAGVPISIIAGTSMGGLVASAYAAGNTIADMEDRALRFSHLKELMKLIDLTPQRRGLLEGQKVRNYIRDWLGERLSFADLQIPTTLTAVDLHSGKEVLLSSGPILPAVFATIAIPGIFKPVIEGGQLLVDGGVLDNLPVMPVQKMGAKFVIAVDVHLYPQNHHQTKNTSRRHHWPIPLPEFFNDFYISELIMIGEITNRNLEITKPDIIIRPDIPPEISTLFGFHRAEEIIRAGENAAREKINDIMATIRL
ncbi:MAG TPA: patatin-like phospholipase family protein [Longilinea sp.]|nr:patatin-like phospholipase family protein [Longilinea sp.]